MLMGLVETLSFSLILLSGPLTKTRGGVISILEMPYPSLAWPITVGTMSSWTCRVRSSLSLTLVGEMRITSAPGGMLIMVSLRGYSCWKTEAVLRLSLAKTLAALISLIILLGARIFTSTVGAGFSTSSMSAGILRVSRGRVR